MKKTQIANACFLALLLAGCGPREGAPVFDQCLRAELFQQCMKSVPAGPVATHENDWSEVVKACDGIAFSQSQRPVSAATKKECFW